MTVESNDEIAIATLSDWLKRLAPVFQPMRAKPKPIAPCTRDFSRASHLCPEMHAMTKMADLAKELHN